MPLPLLTSSNTRIIVDSSSNVPAHLLVHYRMIEVPALVNFGVESLRNNVDIGTDEFYARFARSQVVPTTSQPPPHLFSQAYQQAFDEGAQHLCVVTITSKLSGTFASAQMAAQDFGVERFTLWDANAASIGSGWQAIGLARWLEAGIEPGQLVAKLTALRAATFGFAALETLKYAALSGRVGNLQASIGDLLQIKAILEMRDGRFEAVSRVRGRKRSLQELIERGKATAGDRPINLAVAHANSPVDAEALLAEARLALRVQESHMVDIGPAIAALAGPGAVALMGHTL